MKDFVATIENSTDLLEALYCAQQNKLNIDLEVEGDHRHGKVEIRDGSIQAAHSGILHGNGALLSLAATPSPRMTVVENDGVIEKTISLTLQQAKKFLLAQNSTGSPLSFTEEEQLLQEARRLFFQFQYKSAVEKLVTILKKNRFFYPAWLWQSRIISRKEYILKALDEAYRWGNHDQDIWREARKIRPQIEDEESQAKRCMFCWSILKKDNFCHHCQAFLKISGQPVSSSLKQDDIKKTLAYFQDAFEDDKENGRAAYALAVGYFNLKDNQRALEFMRQAVKLSPQSVLYRKSLSLLLTIARVNRPSQPTSTTAKGTAGKQPPPRSERRNRILLVEDSQTSRKVLSMLFKRHNFEIVEAANGQEALQSLSAHVPDLIILDVMLPDTTGHELLPEIRKIKGMQNIPIIMLTGKHDSVDKMQGLKAGANEYVTKPFNPQKLTAIILKYLKTQTQEKPSGAGQQKSQSVAKAGKPKQHQAANSTQPTAAQPQVPSSNPIRVPAAANDSKSIFVIEDSVTSRKVLSMVLGRNGFTIHEATTGEEALSLAESIQPDLVLLDVMLPDMTGYSVLPQLKQLPHFKDLPVIMLTGKSGSADRMKGMLAGTNEYLTKPFNPQKLLSVIGGYL